jgi:hypothetical protein
MVSMCPLKSRCSSSFFFFEFLLVYKVTGFDKRSFEKLEAEKLGQSGPRNRSIKPLPHILINRIHKRCAYNDGAFPTTPRYSSTDQKTRISHYECEVVIPWELKTSATLLNPAVTLSRKTYEARLGPPRGFYLPPVLFSCGCDTITTIKEKEEEVGGLCVTSSQKI